MRSLLIMIFQVIFSLLMYAMAVIYFGISLAPGIFFFFKVWNSTIAASLLARCIALGMVIAAGYFLFGFTLILLAGGTRSLLRIRLQEGNYKMFSPGATKWAFINCLYLMINYTFINFILLTPFASFLLRLLGAKLGTNVQINSHLVFDAVLLEIGDNTVVGGGAVIIAHVVERGVLKLRKVKIGSNVTIGSHATVMPGCQIGDNAIIGAGAVLLKNTKVEERSIWYGVPAAPIRPKEHRA